MFTRCLLQERLVQCVLSWHILGMKNDEDQQSAHSKKRDAVRQTREERSAQALRDNLRRRKSQAREREINRDVEDDTGCESSK